MKPLPPVYRKRYNSNNRVDYQTDDHPHVTAHVCILSCIYLQLTNGTYTGLKRGLYVVLGSSVFGRDEHLRYGMLIPGISGE